MQNNCLSKKITCSFIAICIGILSFLLPSSLIHAEDRRTVKVGYYTMTGFQNYDEDTKEFSGYSYDYLMAIAQYANWNYEFYPIKMSEGYQMLVDGQLDLMCSITKTEGMEAYVDFASIPSGTNITELVMMPDRTDVSYGDFEAISQLKVGLANINSEYNTPFLQYCEDNSCTPELIYYDTQAEVTQAMKDGAVDASLATNLQNVPAHIIAKFNPQPIYYVTGKGNTELLSELNKAINQVETLDEDFEETLENKYYGDISESTTVLTKAEQEFVKDNPVITVSYDTDWYPISYQNTDGEFAGAFKSIYQMISEKSGLQFKFIPSTDSTDTDMIAEVPYSYPWANTHGWDITTHVVDLMITAMYNGNDSDIQKIAVLPNTYLTDLIKETYGDQYTYIEYASTEEAVDAVKNHEADCIYFSSYEASYYTSLP